MDFTKNFWTIEKLTSRINEVGTKRYQRVFSISRFLSADDPLGENGRHPDEVDFSDELPIQSIWQGLDKYLWLKATIELPVAEKGQRVVGLFDFGVTEGGNNAGFEGLAFLNNQVLQGIDTNHQEVIFTKEQENQRHELAFRLWSGLPGDSAKKEMLHQLKQSDICFLDEKIDAFYYQSLAILQIIQTYDDNRYERIKLTQLLNQTYLKIAWNSRDHQQERQSIYEAADYLTAEVAKLRQTNEITISAFGHAHVDVAWLWRLKHTREKIARTFSSVLKLMTEYDDYTFLQSMPQLYDYLKQDYPDLYQKIKEQVKAGKWEVEGGMWVEADCNIPSGESLVRQLLMGQAFYQEEFAYQSKTLWLPDVFGYSWALPQILKLSNIETFMTTKLGWNEYNSLPTDTFTWRGIDGSEILTHIITTPDDIDQPGFTYNSQMTAEAIVGTWNNYHEKGLNQDLLFAYGYGDGGGGPNREMLEMKSALDSVGNFPTIQSTSIRDYFSNLKQRFAATQEYQHVWNGELYFEFHRGTYTSQGANKKFNRQFELAFRTNEMLNVLASLTKGRTIPQVRFNDMWKILLRNQFHDIIPGSSIKEVYEDSLLEYEQLGQEMTQVADELFTELALSQEEQLTVFNASQWSSPQLVKAVAPKGTAFYQEGKKLTAQRINDTTYLVALATLTPLAYTTITAKSDEEQRLETKSVSPEALVLDTDYYQVTFNSQGNIKALYDKEQERFVNKDGERLNVLQVFTDKPIQFDAWNIDSFYQEKHDEITDLVAVNVTEGDIRTTVSLSWTFGGSKVDQQIHFYQQSKRIDFETVLDWQEPSKLLKVAFPVDLHATEARYDIQYGNVKRPNHWNTSWDFAKFETVAHQWVDMSERNYGVALLNDCKYGHDIKDNIIRLTLVKSAEYPDATQDIGNHQFTYSLLPHQGDFIEGQVVEEAWHLNNPLEFSVGKARNEGSLIILETDHVMIDALKVAEDGKGYILRLHEYGGMTDRISLRSEFTIKEAVTNNLMEELLPDEDLTLADNGISFKLKPYEIKTIRLDFA
ncbi:alpha-mannosidase [Vagococcus sp. BWB3-3]|uniref:Alpha-mannosidase n=1 Tax=Vagococcus allomyrinae TaxID=2794353 RepID=A0A940PDB4_9ENTE|nr:alpha-mannosidase [Vagococcus allomyrinae]MBP1042715.1 alpha-mannosidase [Vagococcus allomyrinae]